MIDWDIHSQNCLHLQTTPIQSKLLLPLILPPNEPTKAHICYQLPPDTLLLRNAMVLQGVFPPLQPIKNPSLFNNRCSWWSLSEEQEKKKSEVNDLLVFHCTQNNKGCPRKCMSFCTLESRNLSLLMETWGGSGRERLTLWSSVVSVCFRLKISSHWHLKGPQYF